MPHQYHGRPVADAAPRVLASNCGSKSKSKSELESLPHHDSLREETYGIVFDLMAPLIRNYGRFKCGGRSKSTQDGGGYYVVIKISGGV